MTPILAVALAFVIVSAVMAVLYQGWTNPLVWIGWAFAVIYIVGPAIGQGDNAMSLLTIILVVVLVLVLVGTLPNWPHAQNWGYFPSGIVAILLVILLVLILTGRLSL